MSEVRRSETNVWIRFPGLFCRDIFRGVEKLWREEAGVLVYIFVVQASKLCVLRHSANRAKTSNGWGDSHKVSLCCYHREIHSNTCKGLSIYYVIPDRRGVPNLLQYYIGVGPPIYYNFIHGGSLKLVAILQFLKANGRSWFLIMYFSLETYSTLAWGDDGNN